MRYQILKEGNKFSCKRTTATITKGTEIIVRHGNKKILCVITNNLNLHIPRVKLKMLKHSANKMSNICVLDSISNICTSDNIFSSTLINNLTTDGNNNDLTFESRNSNSINNFNRIHPDVIMELQRNINMEPQPKKNNVESSANSNRSFMKGSAHENSIHDKTKTGTYEANLNEQNMDKANTGEEDSETTRRKQNLNDTKIDVQNMNKTDVNDQNGDDTPGYEKNMDKANINEQHMGETNIDEQSTSDTNIDKLNINKIGENEQNMDDTNIAEQGTSNINIDDQNRDETGVNEQDIDETNIDGQSTSDTNIVEQNMNETGVNEQNMDATNIDGQSTSNLNIDEQNMDESGVNEQDMDETNIDGQSTSDTNIDEQNINETIVNEQNIDETNLHERNIDETNIAEQRTIDTNTDEQSMNGTVMENNEQDSNTSDYEPDFDITSDSSDSSYSSDQENINTTHTLPKSRRLINVRIGNANISNEQNESVCDDTTLTVGEAHTQGKKKNYCIYCKQMQTNLVRHLERVHKNEEDVQKFHLLPKGTEERRKIIDVIRKNGNFVHNTSISCNKGELLVSRRPRKGSKRTALDFTCCPNCKGFYTKNNIRHHFQECSGKKGFRAVQVMGRKVAGRIHKSASKVLKNEVFPVLREDDVTRCIRYDELIIAFGNKLCRKYKFPHQHDLIRSRLRALGRLFKQIRSLKDKIQSFSDIYNPEYYDVCVQAINIEAKYDEEKDMYGAPSAATRLSTLLKQVGSVYTTHCIKNNRLDLKNNAENFLKIVHEDFTLAINKVAEETANERQRHKKRELPTSEDISKLNNYLTNLRNNLYKALTLKYSYGKWIELAEVTLTLLQLFNRRRAGEIERITIDDFKCHQGINENQCTEIYKSLSEEGQRVACQYRRFEIRGKLGRTVPVLLSADLLAAINMILKDRNKAKVPAENPYVFGIPGYDKKRFKYLRACQLMRKFAGNSGASVPLTLRGTKLRKHIATKCITLDLSENQVADLANFMGHDIAIHKNHYRQPVPELEIVRISKYLEIATGGNSVEDGYSSDSSDEETPTQFALTSENAEPEASTAFIDVEDNADDDNYTASKTKKRPLNASDGRKRRSTSPYGRTKRVRWSIDERNTIINTFKADMKNGRLPKTSDIEELRSRSSALRRRTAPQIKTWIHNCISGKTKICF